MENTKIQWASHTFNPWIGCSRAHEGCDNCYAADLSGRLGVTWGPTGSRRSTTEWYWRQPVRWDRNQRDAACCGAPESDQVRVFPSLCDPFEQWTGPILDHDKKALWINQNGEIDPKGDRMLTMSDLRRKLFQVIDATSLTWILCTKRPQNIREMWPDTNHRKNVWLVYSAANQRTFDHGVEELHRCRALAPVLGVSLEPLLGPVDLSAAKLDWVIVGGESGPKARPCHVDWIRDILSQCAATPTFVKQLGSQPVGIENKLKDRKGGDPSEWPADLRVRQFPK